ncbi:zinc-binding alcohol dehydrogenase family protein [Geomicrobium sp. JSM 1781026]|uniref:zinc-binding alcohol dehydrogenase family protein n=1 Tax=Geomicrobium sp. JSM 1781026 TaxID=3344580 RepID=UPI0035C0C252
MKAIQVKQPHQLDIVDTERPKVQTETDVIVRVTTVGICGSDMHIYHGSNPFTVYPRVIGHEVAGRVEETGAAVTNVKKGDLVALEPIRSCGTCYACKNDRPNVCTDLVVYGVHADGGMSEWMRADERNWHPVEDHVTEEAAALIEPLTIGAQASFRGNIQSGDTVLIMGAGPTGIACLLLAKERGATVWMSDFNTNRLDYATSIGADRVINPGTTDVEEEVTRATDGEMMNVVIDAVGITSTFEQAVQLASVAGTVVTLGFNEQPSLIPSFQLTKKELNVVGSRLQTHQFPTVIKKVNAGELKPEAIISHRFHFKDVKEAFSLLENEPENVRKVVIEF